MVVLPDTVATSNPSRVICTLGKHELLSGETLLNFRNEQKALLWRAEALDAYDTESADDI